MTSCVCMWVCGCVGVPAYMQRVYDLDTKETSTSLKYPFVTNLI